MCVWFLTSMAKFDLFVNVSLYLYFQLSIAIIFLNPTLYLTIMMICLRSYMALIIPSTKDSFKQLYGSKHFYLILLLYTLFNDFTSLFQFNKHHLFTHRYIVSTIPI